MESGVFLLFPILDREMREGSSTDASIDDYLPMNAYLLALFLHSWKALYRLL